MVLTWYCACLIEHTDVVELKHLNLLGVQFALCESSKYFFYLRYESGSIYRPSTRDIEVKVQAVPSTEAARLGAIWSYWEEEDVDEATEVDDDLHPDLLLQ